VKPCFPIPNTKKVGLTAYLFFLCSALIAQNQSVRWEFEPHHIAAYQQVLHLSAPTKFSDPSPHDYPTHYLTNLWEGIEVMITEDPQLWHSYKQNCEKRIRLLGNEKEKSPYKRFYEAEIRIHYAFVQLKFGEEYKAGWNIRQAYRLIEANEKEYPLFLLNAKPKSLLQILLSSVPDKYNWLLSLLGMSGSMEEGLQALQKLKNSSPIFRLEAILLDALVQSFMLQNTQQAAESMELLLKSYPSHPLIRYISATIFAKNHQAERVLEVLPKYGEPFGEIPFWFIEYMRGEALLQKGTYNEAIEAYQRFITHYQGENFQKDARYKIALCFWLSHRETDARKWWKEAQLQGRALTEPDKHAHRWLSDDNFPDPDLMRIRLATDGGYFSKALQLAENVPAQKLKQPGFETEWFYRKARIYHLTGNLEKGYSYYKLTIDHQEKAQGNWYFAPNAALQLGYICMEETHLEKARRYFEKALSYKNHEYKNSIDNKAKAALRNLK
jgi:hypothetical protein